MQYIIIICMASPQCATFVCWVRTVVRAGDRCHRSQLINFYNSPLAAILFVASGSAPVLSLACTALLALFNGQLLLVVHKCDALPNPHHLSPLLSFVFCRVVCFVFIPASSPTPAP
jgi:hypothetical protein